MSYTVVKTGKKTYDGWGNFKCSICSKDVFIQYDSYEKPSTGSIITHKGKCYCLCDRCVTKCINKGKAKVLKDAKDYKPTDDTEYQEPEYLKNIPTEYKTVGSIIPAVIVLGIFAILLKDISKLPKKDQKKAIENLKEKLKKMKKNE